MTMTTEQSDRLQHDLECLPPLPTAADVRDLFSRFTHALWVIGEHAESLGFAASCGAMRPETEALEALMARVIRDVSGLVDGRSMPGNGAPGHAIAMASGLMRSASFATTILESERAFD